MKITGKRIICMLVLTMMILNCASFSGECAASCIKLTKKVTLKQGKSYVLNLKGVRSKDKVKWTVGKKSVVKISNKNKKKCKITAKKPGTTYVRAQYKGKIYKCKVTVVKKNKKEPDIDSKKTPDKNCDTDSGDTSPETMEEPGHNLNNPSDKETGKNKKKTPVLYGYYPDYRLDNNSSTKVYSKGNRVVYSGNVYEAVTDIYVASKESITREDRFKKIAKYGGVSGQHSSQTLSYYKKWKAKYVEKDKYCKKETRYYVRYMDERFNGGNKSVPVTVSEAHGYGMLIMTEMADSDGDAHTIFDGMVRFYNAHRSTIGPHLMSWIQSDNGKAIIDGDEGTMKNTPGDSATDGDMDIAFALLRADRIWGSKGKFNYRQMAIDIINDIWKYIVNKEYYTLSPGDWASKSAASSKYYGEVRCSDFIMAYLPVYAVVTGNQDWMKVYNKTYEIIETLGTNGSTGLLPDFAVPDKATGKYKAASPNMFYTESDGDYSYNSCRCPWRISQDYFVNGNAKAKAWAKKVTQFISTSTNGNASKIYGGYKLDGTPIVSYSDLCFTSPFILAARCVGNTTWYNEVKQKTLKTDLQNYYNDTIKMLVLIEDDKIS